jgi:HAD superfamily hydrolase (TIGR01509 family)
LKDVVPMIDAILFDFVGVLLFPKEAHATDPIVDEIDRQIGKVNNDRLFKEQVLREFNLSEGEFNQILESVVDKYEPYLPLWEILPTLRRTYKLGIINNGTYLTYALFEEKYYISDRFDIFLSSAKEGYCKPDRRIYLRACEAVGSIPGNCLFMDDSQENILGAQRVGMRAIHWPDKENGFKEFIRIVQNRVDRMYN